MFKVVCEKCADEGELTRGDDDGKSVGPWNWRFGAESFVKSHCGRKHGGETHSVRIEEVPDDG